MTKAELNRSIKKFGQQIKEQSLDPYSTKAFEEFHRLHGADNTMQCWSSESWCIMVVCNRRYHYIPTKDFGPTEY
jgi:hypothetical protein